MTARLPLELRLFDEMAKVPKEEWNALLEDEGSPFLRWEWLHALENSGSVCPETGWIPTHFTAWRGKQLVAAAPAYLKNDSHGEFVFDWSWASAAERLGFSYYPKLIFAVPLTPATGRRLLVLPTEDRSTIESFLLSAALEFAREENLSSFHVLFPLKSETESLVRQSFALRQGVQYHWMNSNYQTYEDFLARFNSKRRNQLKREKRSPEEQGIRLFTRRQSELSSVDPADVYNIYASTLEKYRWGVKYIRPKFFSEVMRTMPGNVEWVEARQGGRLVAGAFNLASSQVLYGRYWGCLEEHPFLHFNVCLYHSIEDCIGQKRLRFEPGAGGEHKLARGFEPSLTYSAHWIFNAALDQAVRNFLIHEKKAIEQGMPAWQAETGLRAPPAG